jgi:hypothetical protein
VPRLVLQLRREKIGDRVYNDHPRLEHQSTRRGGLDLEHAGCRVQRSRSSRRVVRLGDLEAVQGLSEALRCRGGDVCSPELAAEMRVVRGVNPQNGRVFEPDEMPENDGES